MMKKIFLSIVFIFIVVMMLPAKVSYVKNDDGTVSAIITFKSNINQANIIGSFVNWLKPGVPMVKNADGVWEYKLLINAPMIKYKFFDPSISDDSAYLDDPEPEEKIANPFGSFDYLIRRSKAIAATGGAGGDGAAGAVEMEEEFAPVFGMWARFYYNFQLMSDFGGKVVYDKDGKAVYVGTASGAKDKDSASGRYLDKYYVDYDNGSGFKERHLVVDNEVGFSWAAWKLLGENGTTEDDYTRIILGRDSFNLSATVKFHGKVSKKLPSRCRGKFSIILE